MAKFIYILLYIISAWQFTAAQNALPESSYSISGFVKTTNNIPLENCNIFIIETKFGTTTNHKGFFLIENLKPQTYHLRISFVGFKTKTIEVELKDKPVKLEINLVKTAFKIGDILVISEDELLSDHPATRVEILSAEIEHFQANSLKDVLDFVPGIEKNANLGLDKTESIAIRSGLIPEDTFSEFATKIIIDGSTESNNTNLQFESLTGKKYGASNIRSSIDLRTIPADNIEKVEVITGIPSARFGDFTSGIINIKTKNIIDRNRLKIKSNPTVNEMNLNGGLGKMDIPLSYNINIARSERDKRLEGDEYTRYTGQIRYSDIYLDGKLKSNYKLFGQAIHDEEKPVGDIYQRDNYNRGYSIGFSNWGDYSPMNNSNFSYSVFAKYRKIDSRRSRLIQSGMKVLPNGDTVSVYVGVVKNKGEEWNLGSKFEYENVINHGNTFHNILAGIRIGYEANTGKGLVLDSLYNYYGANSRKRSYSFDEIPGHGNISLYLEDKITGNFLFDYSLRLGLRYEMYNPESIDFSNLFSNGSFIDSKQGSYLNPRMNLLIYLSKSSRLRLGAGKASKSPPFNTVYQPDQILSWRNPTTGDTEYFTLERKAPNLKGFEESQYEISYSQRLWNKLSFSLTAFYKESSQGLYRKEIPVFHHYEVGSEKKFDYIGNYTKYSNGGTTYNKGLEVFIKTKKIDELNMSFKLSGSYHYSNMPGASNFYDPNPDVSLGQEPNFYVGDSLYGISYKAKGRKRDKLQFNYYLNYKNPELGVWVTLSAEQIVFEHYQNYDLEPVDYSLLNEEALRYRLFLESEKRKPNKWMFNFNLSKSLFKGAEISFYVNNFFDDRALWKHKVSIDKLVEEQRNPNLFYGMEFSMVIDEIFN